MISGKVNDKESPLGDAVPVDSTYSKPSEIIGPQKHLLQSFVFVHEVLVFEALAESIRTRENKIFKGLPCK